MFGIGWTEMLLIGVVALIVIGPKDLPVVMNRLGKAVTSIRRMGSEFQREINKATGLDEIRDIRKSITEPLKQTAAEIRSEFNKPMPGGGFEPSGVIKPKDPGLESVVDEIHAKLKMEAEEDAAEAAAQPYTPFTKEAQEKYRAEQAKPQAVATAKGSSAPKPVESPAPVEAIAPAKKPRAPRKPKSAAPAEPAPVVEVKAAAKPRKPRAAKPKAEA